MGWVRVCTQFIEPVVVCPWLHSQPTLSVSARIQDGLYHQGIKPLTFAESHIATGVETAIAKVGATRFWGDLFMVGLLYHLYNQFAFNTLQRVSPVSHGVCNVVKRIAIIFSSVFFFKQV